jgi:hypothetical protein
MAITGACNYQSYWHLSGIKILFYLLRKIPKDAEKVFNDLISIVWFYFLESLLKVCCNALKNGSTIFQASK